jgi:hypothetical protein
MKVLGAWLHFHVMQIEAYAVGHVAGFLFHHGWARLRRAKRNKKMNEEG